MDLSKNIYSDVNFSVKLPRGLTNAFSSNTGINQGCTLSPLLFNMFIRDMPDTIKECYPVLIEDTSTNLLMYADDLFLIRHSKSRLQACIDRLNQYCRNLKLTQIKCR